MYRLTVKIVVPTEQQAAALAAMLKTEYERGTSSVESVTIQRVEQPL